MHLFLWHLLSLILWLVIGLQTARMISAALSIWPEYRQRMLIEPHLPNCSLHSWLRWESQTNNNNIYLLKYWSNRNTSHWKSKCRKRLGASLTPNQIKSEGVDPHQIRGGPKRIQSGYNLYYNWAIKRASTIVLVCGCQRGFLSKKKQGVLPLRTRCWREVTRLEIGASWKLP